MVEDSVRPLLPPDWNVRVFGVRLPRPVSGRLIGKAVRYRTGVSRRSRCFADRTTDWVSPQARRRPAKGHAAGLEPARRGAIENRRITGRLPREVGFVTPTQRAAAGAECEPRAHAARFPTMNALILHDRRPCVNVKR